MMQTTETQAFTIELIEKYAIETGKRYEIHYPHSYCANYNDSISGQGYFCDKFNHFQIGIELKSGIWFWWAVKYVSSCDEYNDYLFFQQRYNQNNGHMIKAWGTGYKAEKMILEYFNK